MSPRPWEPGTEPTPAELSEWLRHGATDAEVISSAEAAAQETRLLAEWRRVVRTRWVKLGNEDAGVVCGFLVLAGVRATVRGGPKGGSKGGTVIVPDQGLVIEPGDECSVVDGVVVVR